MYVPGPGPGDEDIFWEKKGGEDFFMENFENPR